MYNTYWLFIFILLHKPSRSKRKIPSPHRLGTINYCTYFLEIPRLKGGNTTLLDEQVLKTISYTPNEKFYKSADIKLFMYKF